MADKNITIHQKNDSGTYDNLYPNITNSNLPSPLIVTSNPTNSMGVATKNYVDTNNDLILSTIASITNSNSGILKTYSATGTLHMQGTKIFNTIGDYLEIVFNSDTSSCITQIHIDCGGSGGTAGSTTYTTIKDSIKLNGINVYEKIWTLSSMNDLKSIDLNLFNEKKFIESGQITIKRESIGGETAGYYITLKSIFSKPIDVSTYNFLL